VGEGEADSPLSREPDAGPDPRILASLRTEAPRRPSLKSS